MNELESIYIDDFEKIRQIIEQAKQEAACKVNENINRATKDGRDEERIKRGIANTFSFYDAYAYPVIDTTVLTPKQVAEQIIKTAGI